ncbi:hypothetical protein [Micromonospora cremea]|uniref:Uncharacterized protein n=1 Tax=Micromonospora cremea TaxID=709881 RepID=A0A1N6BDG9_9ACTN|nr:hypothetical protein [Micromonospora cremea]SIN44409.1 hypothetical protein SAMN04489832_7246 [Micromonospora cremea]
MDRVDGVLLPELDGPEPSAALPRALGWLSLALGIYALAEPGPLARLTGVDDDPASWAVIRAGRSMRVRASAICSSSLGTHSSQP